MDDRRHPAGPPQTPGAAAVEKFLQGYNCAQSVLWSFRKELNLDADLALKVACGFGAGMARKQEVCGAVTGGIMVLGLRHGRAENQDRVATEQTYRKTQELIRRFELKHGSCRCRDLLQGCDLTTEAGQKFFKENDLHSRTCKECVKTVVAILEDLG
jgi:C_GCAxxG_C_C family probable redox protein